MCSHTSHYETFLSSGICSPSATENVAEGQVILEKGSVKNLEVAHQACVGPWGLWCHSAPRVIGCIISGRFCILYNTKIIYVLFNTVFCIMHHCSNYLRTRSTVSHACAFQSARGANRAFPNVTYTGKLASIVMIQHIYKVYWESVMGGLAPRRVRRGRPMSVWVWPMD